MEKGIGMSEFRQKCIGKTNLVGIVRRHPACRRGGSDGAVRPRFPLHRLGACPDFAATRSRTWCARPTCIACRPWCAFPATRRKRSRRRWTAARKACSCRASRPPPRPQAAVKASRYPPQGERGVGPGRAAGYGYRIPEYLAEANARIVVAVQVETAEGLANIEAIAAVDGVDVIFVGPGDLSVSIDAIGPKGADKLNAGDPDDHRRDDRARQDRRHILRQPAAGRPMGRHRRQLLHPGQRHDVSRRRRCGQLCRRARRTGTRRTPVARQSASAVQQRKTF